MSRYSFVLRSAADRARAMKVVAAIKAAKSDAEIKAWIDVNELRLQVVAQNDPKIYDRINTNIEVASDKLKRSAA